MWRFLIIVLLMYFFGLAAQAAGVYKWVDEQGKVHYGDRPGNNNASKIAVPSSPSPSDKTLSERNAKRDKLLQTMEEERKLKEEEGLKTKQKEAERARRCIEAKDTVRRYERARYIYTPTEGDKEIILSEDERKKAMDEARKAVVEWCG